MKFALWVIVGIPIIFIEPIYVMMGQDPEVAAMATTYVHIVFPFTIVDAIG